MESTVPPPSASSRPAVLIFRSELLIYSETFIPAQAEPFQTFTPHYAGFKPVEGLTLPPERTLPLSHFVPMIKLRTWGAALGWLEPGFLQAVRRVQPVLIHAHFEDGGMKMLALARRLKLPLVVTCHGGDEVMGTARWERIPGLGGYLRGRKASLLRTARRFFGVSRHICDRMIRRGYPAEKMCLHYIGVDAERFRPDPAVAKQPSLLFVGRFVEYKGCIDLLKALKIVKTKFPDIRLDLVGDGSLREGLETYAREEKLNVRFHGRQDSAAIRRFMREALMLCIPSYTYLERDAEGLAIVTLEAQATGIPVVGTINGGIPEGVEHGVTGLLSAERDPAAMADNILTLLADPALLARMGQAARARVEEHFDVRRQSALLEKAYLELI